MAWGANSLVLAAALGAMFMAGSAPVYAEAISCDDLGQSASVILEGRLSGLSRATVLNIVASSSSGPAWQQAVSAVVDAAFAEPLPSSPGARLMAVRDFGALIKRSCDNANVAVANVVPPTTAVATVAPEKPSELPNRTLFAEPFSSEVGAGFQLVVGSSEGMHTYVVYCTRAGRGPAVISNYPDYEIYGQEVLVSPGGEAMASSDEDDYRMWHQMCQPEALGAGPDAKIQAVIDLYSQSDNACRGGAGDDPATVASCEAREVYARSLEQAGFCPVYGAWRECQN